MRQSLLYLSIFMLTACASVRIEHLPAPLLSQPNEFDTIEACEAKLADLYAQESKKKEQGESYVELKDAHCEQQGATAGDVVGGFFVLVLGAAAGTALYFDSKY